ncbi:MAG TPA: LacI family DNA-binding transcriptional regulator [Opitutaceae bacterium]|nr:LacI family DNA-binding transcriptional regulator [Opitutaceae bacterium]
MPTPSLPSMADVARAAGVHQTTVSRALRNDRRLPAATRDRIRRAAHQLGYRPNPLVSALVALRRARHPSKYEATLAFVAVSELGPSGEQQLAGARRAAEELGYKLDLFTLHRRDLTPDRLDHVLLARGIHGIVIAPLPMAHGGFDLTWDRYCSVVIEYTFTSSPFDRVVHDSYDGMRRIMHECRKRGFSRVGLALTTVGQERTERLNDAAYWVEQRADAHFAPIPPLITPTWDRPVFQRWLAAHRPEVIITSNALLEEVLGWCHARRRRPGRDIRIVNVNAAPDRHVAGIVQNHAAIGVAAVQLLIAKLNRNDRGIPSISHTILTPGQWWEGNTLAQPAD